jgi:predicted ATP-dependent Lon-type protease
VNRLTDLSLKESIHLVATSLSEYLHVLAHAVLGGDLRTVTAIEATLTLAHRIAARRVMILSGLAKVVR